MRMSDAGQALWDVATALNRAAAAVSPLAVGLPPLIFFTDPLRTPEPWRIAGRLPPGAAVVYRSFGAGDAEIVGERLRAVTFARKVRLLIGLDAGLARRIGADGVHLPERALNVAAALADEHPDWLITGAVHSGAAMTNAPSVRAFVLSPIFAAGGASGARPALGVDTFNRLTVEADRPVYALGGVSTGTAAVLAGSHACGLCGIDGIAVAFTD